jgi:predicted peroxiredoxin
MESNRKQSVDRFLQASFLAIAASRSAFSMSKSKKPVEDRRRYARGYRSHDGCSFIQAEGAMSKFLIHIHSGPRNPTKSTLGCLIAATALKEGHEVSVFLAGAGVHLLSPIHAALEGNGTGKLVDHLEAIADGGGRIYASEKSARARDYDDALLEGHPAEFAMPEMLVRLADEADTVLCY